MDYVQTVGDAVTDMGAAIISLDSIRPFTGLDSAILLLPEDRRLKAGTPESIRMTGRLIEYMRLKDTPLAEYWLCTYAINNPFLNGARQEITKYFILKGDTVVGTISPDDYAGITAQAARAQAGGKIK